MTTQVLPNYTSALREDILVPRFNRVLLFEHKKANIGFKEAAKILGTSSASYAHYLHGRTTGSIKMLHKFSELYKSNLFEKVFLEDFEFSGRNKTIKLPRIMTPKLAYYVGYLQGDGYLGGDGKRLGFADECNSQLEKINGMTKELFKKEGKIVETISRLSKKPSYKLEIKSTVINSFLNTVFGFPKGTKENLSIPILIKSNRAVLKYYLSGLYDADGTLPKTPEKAKQFFIDITLKDRTFIEELKEALSEFGIETQKVYRRKAISFNSNKPSITWELRIRRREHLLKFLWEISFYHPEKAKRAKELEKIILDR